MGDAVHGERVQAHLLCHHQQPQKALLRSLGKEFAKSMSHFTPNPMRSIPSRHDKAARESARAWPGPSRGRRSARPATVRLPDKHKAGTSPNRSKRIAARNVLVGIKI